MAEELIVELVRAATRVGAIARVRTSVQGTDEAYLLGASDEQLDNLPRGRSRRWARSTPRISVHAAWNTRELTAIDPAKVAAQGAGGSAAHGPVHGAVGVGRPALVRDRRPV